MAIRRRNEKPSTESPKEPGWRPLEGPESEAPSDAPASDERGSGASERPPAGSEVRFEGVGVVGGVIVMIVAVAVLIAVLIQNTSDVDFELFWFDVEAPLVVFLLGAALFAVLVDQVIGLVWRRRRRELRQLREEVGRRREGDEGASS